MRSRSLADLPTNLLGKAPRKVRRDDLNEVSHFCEYLYGAQIHEEGRMQSRRGSFTLMNAASTR
jgi:hypothetical protein